MSAAGGCGGPCSRHVLRHAITDPSPGRPIRRMRPVHGCLRPPWQLARHPPALASRSHTAARQCGTCPPCAGPAVCRGRRSGNGTPSRADSDAPGRARSSRSESSGPGLSPGGPGSMVITMRGGQQGAGGLRAAGRRVCGRVDLLVTVGCEEWICQALPAATGVGPRQMPGPVLPGALHVL